MNEVQGTRIIELLEQILERIDWSSVRPDTNSDAILEQLREIGRGVEASREHLRDLQTMVGELPRPDY